MPDGTYLRPNFRKPGELANLYSLQISKPMTLECKPCRPQYAHPLKVLALNAGLNMMLGKYAQVIDLKHWHSEDWLLSLPLH